MNSKTAKKIRQNQRRMMPDIEAEVQIAIEKAFLMGVEVGWKKAVDRYEETGDTWPHGPLREGDVEEEVQ